MAVDDVFDALRGWVAARPSSAAAATATEAPAPSPLEATAAAVRRWRVRCTFMQVYNEKVYDLVPHTVGSSGGAAASGTAPGMGKPLPVRDSLAASASEGGGGGDDEAVGAGATTRSSFSSSGARAGAARARTRHQSAGVTRRPGSVARGGSGGDATDDGGGGGGGGTGDDGSAARWATTVVGLAEHDVGGTAEVLELLARGVPRRVTRATNLNDASSRTHTICTLHVETEEDVPAPATGAAGAPLTHKTAARINFVDLAGSERCKLG